ncbi:MAG: hypothetical protein IKI97_04415 [Clostridia bacterium]|nr:hypothetical protein [Clostridia bacterium]
MKKSTIKGIISGILAGIITVVSLPAIAEGIEVAKNSVNIRLNGEKVASENENYVLQNGAEVPYSILYEGTTYLPVRKLSELLDVTVGWDNDTRTVILDKNSEVYDGWYGVPDFGEVCGINEIGQIATVRSTTHWYDVTTVEGEDDYIKELERLGFEKVTNGNIKPKFNVYKKGNIEVWLDLGMYTQLVYGVTVMNTTRPITGKDYEYSGTQEDIPNFSSAFGYSAKNTNSTYYYLGELDLWAHLPDYLSLLDEEGFSVSSSSKSFYGRGYTLKKGRSTVSIRFNGTEFSNIPAVEITY